MHACRSTLEDPTGDASSFDALGLTPGSHVFEVIGHVGVDASAAAICEVSITAPVESLFCTVEVDTVELTWSLGSLSYSEIRVLRNGGEIAVLSGSAVSYTDSALGAGSYDYEVVAVESGSEALAATCSVEVLVTIVRLHCTAIGDDVFLQWTNGQIYDSIEISRDGSPIATVDGASNVYTDEDVPSGEHEYSLVPSVEGSQAVAATCSVTVLDPISGLTCTSDGDEITLSWTNGSAYDSIEIRRNGGLLATLAGDATSYVDTTPPGVYVYSLVGSGGGGTSEAATCEVVDAGSPSGLTCAALAGEVQVSWTNGGAYDQIEVRVDGDLETTLPGSATSVELGPIGTGDHEICVNGVVGGDSSGAACCTITVPAAITGFTCTANGDDVHLSWNSGQTYASIEVFRDGESIGVIPGNLESYFDTGVPAGEHDYAIAGSLGGGTTASVTCTVNVLDPIGTVTCSGDSGSATINFAAAGTYGSIRIHRNGNLVATLAGTASSYTQTGLTQGTYEYCVTGVSGSNETEPSCCTIEVPGPAFGLICEVIGGDDVELNWQNSQAGDGISIERDGVEIERLSGSVNTFTDQGVEAGEHEYCVINVIDGYESLAACCTVRVPLPAILFECSSTPDGVLLTWQNGEDYGGVQILRDGLEIAELGGSAESFTDTEASAGEHDYQVIGIVDGFASSSVSCEVDVANPVTGLTCTNTGDGIELNWLVPAGTDQIQVYRNGALLATLAGTATTYFDELSIPGDYAYEVFAIDGGEYSPPAECGIDVLEGVADLTCCATDGEVEICWTNSDSYTSIRVYRNASLAATLSGSATCYVENRSTGTYSYVVVGVLGPATSSSAGCTVRVAGPISGLSCQLAEPNCLNSDVLLSWNVSETFDSIEIYRDGSLVGTVGGAVESFTDADAGAPHDYQVVGIFTGDMCGAESSLVCELFNALAQFIRGNANNDPIVNIADAVFTFNYLFVDGPTPICKDAADSNDNGAINIADAVYTLMYLFQQGRLPPAPFPDDGVDPTCDTLDCDL